MTDRTIDKPNFTEHAAEIVGAYVAHNHIALAEVPNLIRSVHETLVSLGQPASAEVPAEPLKPAVPVKKSVTDDFIISLEDGRKFRTMKKHLAGLGMTPADYRAKWGLHADYPMVAPAYAARRSELAKGMGLGRKASAPAPAPQPEPEPEAVAPAPKRGRAKKAA